MTAQAQPGQQLLRLVQVMDTLLSPGGCPWDAEQTHETLAPYAVEEAYELVEAISSGNPDDIADELGDVLLQVVFHARVAQNAGTFDVDDVAERITEKLYRRHPHVFANVDATTPEQVEANWDAIKAAEKPERRGPLDGIPTGMPPLERAVKVVSRLERAGLGEQVTAAARGKDLGAQMLALVLHARESNLDVAIALRGTLAALEADVAAADRSSGG
ncbi:nucleoside triphosphate pyrophosphohydrolase [Gephyromycinifex aptenodytis]|uniref:nucleoside triphosphate pyrophosphohydrolase n=1 Tax=Gephyromycinifex aptenodytis TaxID=2716227 RepID=UPI00144835C6|nr:MazG family protein [Gephyromycinifex aptenodytis]